MPTYPRAQAFQTPETSENGSGAALLVHPSANVAAGGCGSAFLLRRAEGVFSCGAHWRSLEHCLASSFRTKELQV